MRYPLLLKGGMVGVNTPLQAEENLHQTSTSQGKYRLMYRFSSASAGVDTGMFKGMYTIGKPKTAVCNIIQTHSK